MKVERARREDYLALLRESYGDGALTAAELDWWFRAEPHVESEALDEDGTPLGVLSMTCLPTSAGLGAFVVHGVTAPAARGRGVYSTLEAANEEWAAAAGAAWAFCFANARTIEIFRRLGWTELPPLRLWARLRRPTRRGVGGFRVEPVCPPFEARHEREFAAAHVLRDAATLTWRYADSPRRYHRVEAGGGWAVVTHRVWHGFSIAAVCEAVGPALAANVRRAVRAVDSELALALVDPGEEAAYLAAGFLPTPKTMPLVARRLRDDAPPLPAGRRGWRFTLGDMDFF
ncbi:MAG TPA: GNAT family N-acetyltransferase [Gaiellaceae bacterium]|nr:GNAT family N-acetyltransferase [Gaiellaceae bacterium]